MKHRRFARARLARALATASLGCAAFVALSMGAREVRAEYGSYAPRPQKEPSWIAEIRFGPYHPNVDAAFSNGATPYQTVFGSSTRFMIAGEVDWQFLRVEPYGSLGVGGKVGYTFAQGLAQFADGSGTSGENTKLEVIPFSALLVGRLDLIARKTWVPIVPYAKIGPSIALWTASNDAGLSRSSTGKVGQGKTYGFEWAIGAALQLDAFDRTAAKSFANSTGVLHSYFFGELTQTQLNDFGSKSAMWLGDTTWNLGLSFEM